MTTTIEPYVHFNGDCEAALALYKKAFRGEVTSLMRFSDAPMPTAPGDKSKIMHATFVADGVKLMASDAQGDKPVIHGSSFRLSLNFTDVAEQDRVWAVLSEGATIVVPLEVAFWGARFGMLDDKFGTPWMFNCEVKK